MCREAQRRSYAQPVVGVDRRAMTALSVGHGTTDLSAGAVSALLVFLRPELGLSFTEAAAVVLVATISSSIIQPIFGVISDSRGAIWLLPGGVLLSGFGIALAAVAPSYPLLLLFVLIAGLGIAAYHPEASKFASFVSGSRRATGMSFFSIGGNVGFATGPLLASGLILWLGLEGGLLMAVPAVVVAGVLVRTGPYLLKFAPEGGRRQFEREGDDRPWALVLLLVIVTLRSVGHMGLFAFVPLWEVDAGRSEAYASVVLALFLFGGAVGTLAGGPMADRIGRRQMLTTSLTLAVPLTAAYILAGGGGGVVAITLAGAMLVSSFAVTIVMSQDYLPSRVGLASGLSIGFAIGLGGVAAIALGALADAVDLRTALLVSLIGPAAAAVLTFGLPSAGRPVLRRPVDVTA